MGPHRLANGPAHVWPVSDAGHVVRRVHRRGGVNLIRAIMRRSAASSSGVHEANDFSRRTATWDAIGPSVASSSS